MITKQMPFHPIPNVHLPGQSSNQNSEMSTWNPSVEGVQASSLEPPDVNFHTEDGHQRSVRSFPTANAILSEHSGKIDENADADRLSVNRTSDLHPSSFWALRLVYCISRAIKMFKTLFRRYWHASRAVYLHIRAYYIMASRHKEGIYQRKDLDAAITLYSRALKLRPSQSSSINNLGNALLTRFEQGGPKTDLDEAITLHRRVLELLPLPSADRLVNLANALFTRFNQDGQQSDLDEVISVHIKALKHIPSIHRDRLPFLNDLAVALSRRFEQDNQQKDDLDQAISLHRQVLDLHPSPHADRSMSLINIGNALLLRFEDSGHHADLDEAISFHKQALELHTPPHPYRPSSLNSLGNALFARFKRDGQRTDLDESISLYMQALSLCPSPHPDRLDSLNALGTAFLVRFEEGGQELDLNDVISLCRRALELHPSLHADRSVSLNNLGNSLRTRFVHGGKQTDLDEAISLHRQARELCPSPNTRRLRSLRGLAIAILTRIQQGGQQIDFDEVISFRVGVLTSHFGRPPSLDDRAHEVRKLVVRSDLIEVISLYRELLKLQPSSDPDRWVSLNNLGNVLRLRGSDGSLDEATSLHEEALKLCPTPHPGRPTLLLNLAADQQNLDKAISLYKEALSLPLSAYTDQPRILSKLAGALLAQFERQHEERNLDESISLYRQALYLSPRPHLNRSNALQNLAGALMARYMHLVSQKEDLVEVISLCMEALEFRPVPHPDRASSLFALGTSLLYAIRDAGEGAEYLEQPLSSFFNATHSRELPPGLRDPKQIMTRLNQLRTWKVEYNTPFMDAFDVLELQGLSWDIHGRQPSLVHSLSLPNHEAVRLVQLAISQKNLDLAVQFLEGKRTMILSQVLAARSHFNNLRNSSPKLADQLRGQASKVLMAFEALSDKLFDKDTILDTGPADQLEAAFAEWNRMLEETIGTKQVLPFEHHSSISTLRFAASDYSIVFLVHSETGGDCLIMTSKSIHHIGLINLTTAVLEQLVQLVRLAVSSLRTSRSSIEEIQENLVQHLGEERGMRMERGNFGSSDDVLKYVSKVLWIELVKPVVDLLDLKKTADVPVLKWCLSGLFNFLPIHAAGCYEDDTAVECAPDYFISSYTPSVGILLAPNPTPTSENFKMMVVIQSRGLPATQRELEIIERHVPNDSLVKLGVPGTEATIEAVASGLSDASIVHFACHGRQMASHPMDSGLELDDGLLRIRRIMKETIPNGSLAFLCACDTAMVDTQVPDEMMSLGASLLFSGFRNVIATMWEMRDEDGPIIADTFYEELFRGADGRPAVLPDTAKSAQALHIAVKKLRSKNVSFRRWIPFIHMGK